MRKLETKTKEQEALEEARKKWLEAEKKAKEAWEKYMEARENEN